MYGKHNGFTDIHHTFPQEEQDMKMTQDITAGRTFANRMVIPEDKIAAASSTLVANYSDATTVIREAAINGLEAIEGIEGGHVTVNIEPHFEARDEADDGMEKLKKYLSPFQAREMSVASATVTISDNGCGMSPEFVRDGLVKIKVSTKDNDDSKNGGFGIGSKGPLAYSDTLAWRTTKDGVTTTAILGRDSNEGFGYDDPVSVETDEPNGTTVTFVVDGKTYRDINRTIFSNFAAYMDPETLTVTIDGKNVPVGDAVYGDGIKVGDALVVNERDKSDDEWGHIGDRIVFRGSPYPAPSRYSGNMLFNEFKSSVNKWISDNGLLNVLYRPDAREPRQNQDKYYSAVLNVDSLFGKVIPLPNREAVQNTEEVRDSISKLIEECVFSTLDEQLNELKSARDLNEWQDAWTAFTSNGIVKSRCERGYGYIGTGIAPVTRIHGGDTFSALNVSIEGKNAVGFTRAMTANNTQHTMAYQLKGLNDFLAIENSSKMCEYSYMCEDAGEFIGFEDTDYAVKLSDYESIMPALPEKFAKSPNEAAEFLTGARVTVANNEAVREALMQRARKEVATARTARYINVYMDGKEEPKRVANASGLYSIFEGGKYTKYISTTDEKTMFGHDPRVPRQYEDAPAAVRQAILDEFANDGVLVIEFCGYDGASTIESIHRRFGFGAKYKFSVNTIADAAVAGACGVSRRRLSDARTLMNNNIAPEDMARFITAVTGADKDRVATYVSDMNKVFDKVFEKPEQSEGFITTYAPPAMPSRFDDKYRLAPAALAMAKASFGEDNHYPDPKLLTERFLAVAEGMRLAISSAVEQFPEAGEESEAA